VFEVRIHGRGGQGVVTAAEMLSIAAFEEGHWAQAFPSFGSERMGAPVVAFVRIDDKEIRTREPVTNPNALIIQDPTLLHVPKLLDGLEPGGHVLINSTRQPEELGIPEIIASLPNGNVRTLGATEIAQRHVGRPVPNAALLGALCAATKCVGLAAVEIAIRRKFKGDVAEKNVAAAREAFVLCGGVLPPSSNGHVKGAARHAQAV
jgi:pyruvate ferredoxin oxidoreductase gamma subunit